MLGLVLIYWIGKYFYVLAEKYNQNKWLFAVLGVVMYYFGTLVAGVFIGIAIEVFDVDFNLENTFLLSVIALPFGIAFCWTFYYLLEKSWKKIASQPIENIDEIGKDIDEIGM